MTDDDPMKMIRSDDGEIKESKPASRPPVNGNTDVFAVLPT